MTDSNITETTYFDERMAQLGITPELNSVNLWKSGGVGEENSLQPQPIFQATERGIDIFVYSLNRHFIRYKANKSRWRKEYKITRLAEPIIKKGKEIKYLMPAGQPTRPFFPPELVDKYDAKQKIKVLYLTEGYFKAFKAQMHGIDCVGLASITCMKDKETGKLYSDILKLVHTCQVERLVYLTDGDCRDITSKQLEDEVDLYKRPRNFFNTIAAFHDLCSDLDDVQRYFAHINSYNLEGKPKGIDDLLMAMPDDVANIAQEANTFSHIVKGITQGTYFVKMQVTYSVGQVRQYFKLDSVENFYHFHVGERERVDMKNVQFKFNGTLYKYNEDKKECEVIVPGDAKNYFRCGDDYFEFVQIPDQYGNLTQTYARRVKQTIVDDHGKNLLKHVPKYKAFCSVPDHVNYQRVHSNCFNQYHPFVHEPDEGDFSYTLDYIKHIFSENDSLVLDENGKPYPIFELALDYLTILYKYPQQMLPIICLVSKERGTGKTTFIKYLKMLFTENAIIVGNDDLKSQFNAPWAGKLIIACDETKIDKFEVVEKVKSLSTGFEVLMNGKNKEQTTVKFFGKFIFLSNNEDNFINIDAEETRFWVHKPPVLEKDIPNIIDHMIEEIPAFLNYLNKRKMITKLESRHWFLAKFLKTEALEKVQSSSRPQMEIKMRLAIKDIFLNSDVQEIPMCLKVLAENVMKKPNDTNYFQKLLNNMGYKSQPSGRKMIPYLESVFVQEGKLGEGYYQPKVMMYKHHGTYYLLQRADFVAPEEEPIELDNQQPQQPTQANLYEVSPNDNLPF